MKAIAMRFGHDCNKESIALEDLTTKGNAILVGWVRGGDVGCLRRSFLHHLIRGSLEMIRLCCFMLYLVDFVFILNYTAKAAGCR